MKKVLLFLFIFLSYAQHQTESEKEFNVHIRFNKQMDTTSVRENIEVMNLNFGNIVEIKKVVWTDDCTNIFIVLFDPSVFNDTSGLNYSCKYKVTIRGSAKDINGFLLDGNRNGISEGTPIDDYSFTFTTRKAHLKSYFSSHTFPSNITSTPNTIQPLIFYSTLTNREKHRDFNIELSVESSGAGSCSLLTKSIFLPPDTILRFPTLTVEYWGDFQVYVYAKCFSGTLCLSEDTVELSFRLEREISDSVAKITEPNILIPTIILNHGTRFCLNMKLAEIDEGRIEIYDQIGRCLERFVVKKGEGNILLYSERFPSGVYFVRIITKESTSVKKVVILRH
ncbi:MAG: T9SS type A sorting domain-containing protein [candidate division WOR-3 bacterium]